MNKSRSAWINLLFLISTLAINALGATGMINGLSQKDISDRYLTLITPSPFTFSIWSLIYALLLFSLIAMLIKRADQYYQQAMEKVSGLFRLSSALNMLWIISFSYLWIEVSSGFTLAMAITLALICQRLLAIHQKGRWLLPATFGLYTGWLLIATVANVVIALVKLEWSGWGISPASWAIAILGIAIVLAGLVLRKTKNAFIPLPLAWAYFGIYHALHSVQGFAGAYPQIELVAMAGIVVLIALSMIQLYRNGLAVLPEKNY